MAQLQRTIDGVTEYAYREVEVQSGTIMGLIWDESDARHREVTFASGASNERQLLLIPDSAKSVDHLALQDAVVDDVHYYSLAADNADYDDMMMDKIRSERDSLLKDCDFSQLSDSPLDGSAKTAWATYRQELRDLPSSITDVDDVSWPVKPA